MHLHFHVSSCDAKFPSGVPTVLSVLSVEVQMTLIKNLYTESPWHQASCAMRSKGACLLIGLCFAICMHALFHLRKHQWSHPCTLVFKQHMSSMGPSSRSAIILKIPNPNPNPNIKRNWNKGHVVIGKRSIASNKDVVEGLSVIILLQLECG